jgi:iron complex transport system substrate-binding protein
MFFISCGKSSERKLNVASHDSLNSVRYAAGFDLQRDGSKTIITVKNPWQHASGIEYTYILSDSVNSSSIVDEYHTILKTPVQRVVCLSTTHIGFIGFLQKENSVIGVSGKDYVVNNSIRNKIAENQVVDVGYDENLNYELIIRLKPDVVFAYGVNVSITNTVKKLNELGIPVVLIGEYLEEDPLAKMEWVKVFASCYHLHEINSQFDLVVTRYNALKAIAAKDKIKPTVLLGLPWRGTWYVSGAHSYIARMINDAGGSYIWQNLEFNESTPMGLEKIYEKALTASYWINPGEARSKKDIFAVDERFAALPSISSDHVFNNDNQLNATGGNDFYESGVTEPDIILSDLVYILHPHLLPSYKLKYYRKLR